MGYSVRLGYFNDCPGAPHSEVPEWGNFRIALVEPFTGGSSAITAPPTVDRSAVSYEPNLIENEDEQLTEPGEFFLAPLQNEDGLVEANIGVTNNYSARIVEVAGAHLDLLMAEKTAAESAPHFMRLIAELGDDFDPDYFKPTDGNIKHLASTLLSWSFQHPEACFVII